MSDQIRRRPGGQFAAGQSGNSAGARLRKPDQLLTLKDMLQTDLRVASEVVGFKDGKPVTRYENAVRMLAKGDSANRLATRDFVEHSTNAARNLEALERSEARREQEQARRERGR
ncbi:hypothetical protein ASE70_16710 [Sphingomonas sp. Leaf22]|uniref:hypothetical protein n=1 Tax=Sphingomonas sp. Leaf22 TaxID=1735687 RepID=UPI000701D156|nr:hypothetical protein [Sphingomonas sp. Leaf22]KQM89208.1 hypothetical protein ASE70_16710 [Sphingomonas sp. Leaf22]